MTRPKDEKLEIFIKKLNQNFGKQVKKIILFGSRAREDSVEFSDYDILIIFDKTSPQIKGKLQDLAGEMLYEYSVVFSVFCFNEEDLYRRRYSPLFLNIQKEGIVL